MIQIDAYIDPITGDLPEVTRLTTGIELIQQRIRLRLYRGTGEWFLDPLGTGLPLIAWRNLKPPPVQLITGRIEAEIRKVPGVISTSDFVGVHDPAAHLLTVSGTATAADGAVTAVVITIPVGARNVSTIGVFFAPIGTMRGGLPRPGRP